MTESDDVEKMTGETESNCKFSITYEKESETLEIKD